MQAFVVALATCGMKHMPIETRASVPPLCKEVSPGHILGIEAHEAV
jgi:hypothetical protein